MVQRHDEALAIRQGRDRAPKVDPSVDGVIDGRLDGGTSDIAHRSQPFQLAVSPPVAAAGVSDAVHGDAPEPPSRVLVATDPRPVPIRLDECILDGLGRQLLASARKRQRLHQAAVLPLKQRLDRLVHDPPPERPDQRRQPLTLYHDINDLPGWVEAGILDQVVGDPDAFESTTRLDRDRPHGRG